MNTDMEIKMKRVFENAGIEFPEDTQLDLEKLGVDSVLLLHLIVNIEKAYEIKIPDDELLYENFSSLSTIYEFVNRLLQKEE